jgi:hypothetical protein
MRMFAVGAHFPARDVRALAEPLLRKRLFVRECEDLLEALSHKQHCQELRPLLARARRLT